MSRLSTSLAEHFASPQNVGELNGADGVGVASIGGRPPYVTFFVKLAADKVQQAKFVTFGCGYSIAACSALTVMSTGSTLQECQQMSGDGLIEALGGIPPHKRYCAELAIAAMHNAVADAKAKG